MKQTYTELKNKQTQYAEGSLRWREIQDQLDQIIAERYLEYVNR